MTNTRDDDVEKQSRTSKPRRSKIMRVDSLVGNAKREIEKVFELPRGSVQIVLPNGKNARKDKLIGSLIDDWNKK
jgi:hypothetical protein